MASHGANEWLGFRLGRLVSLPDFDAMLKVLAPHLRVSGTMTNTGKGTSIPLTGLNVARSMLCLAHSAGRV